jgi:Uma2 family endonuclease
MDNQDKEFYVKESLRQYSAEKQYTYADYASWDDGNRYELIDGEVFLMSAPSQVHQTILGELFYQLYSYLKGKPCKIFVAPFDVCLFGLGDDDKTVVQPDLLVICDKSKLADGKRCNGSPDMVIEILSPSNRSRDMLLKFNKYLSAGITEYWIIDPEIKSVHVHILENGRYTTNAFGKDEIVPVHILDGCQINMKDVFDTSY